jgi:hypothetical protein
LKPSRDFTILEIAGAFREPLLGRVRANDKMDASDRFSAH